MEYLKFKEQLQEGIYHEIGHIIASWMCFPGEDRVKCLQMKKNPNGSYGIQVLWKDEIRFNAKTQLDAFCITSLAGGIFQQLQRLFYLYRDILDVEDSSPESYNSEDVLRLLSIKEVKSYIPGMEEDMARLLVVFEKIQIKGITEDLFVESARIKTIDTLLPFVCKPQIESLCMYCLDLFWNEGLKRKDKVDIDVDIITEYIGCLFK